jgi:DNA-3-methyladenine glycosylase I
MNRYHDEEWGLPLHDEAGHYAFLVLEAAQAGLSWRTVLHKREGYRRAFAGFDCERVARYGEAETAALLADPGIIRNRLKVTAAIHNARKVLELRAKEGSFSGWLWSFVDGRPVINRWERLDQIPPTSPLSDRVSRELKARGFKFVGSTVIYSHLQAAGLVNDHLVQCRRWREVQG